jgi:adenylate cyclase
MPRVERKLTTILAADVVGYSKLMGKDEAGTLQTLKVCREIIDGVIAEHRGRVFGSAGDSVLAEFPSPVEAVWCAAKFQKLLADRDAHPATARPMQFRVGINLGDVMIEGENLYGDGVNIASRLEGIAAPGGVCLSAKVYEEVKRKLDIQFADGGQQQLKNIDDPIAVYHVRTTDEAGSDQGATTGGKSVSAPKTATTGQGSEMPTVIVRPLKVLGAAAEVGDIAVGLTEDIVGSLAKQTSIKVLAYDAPHQEAAEGGAIADFALEGSIRASGRQLRLSFSLVDLRERSQVWTERYDRGLDDVFKLQDEISRNVASTVRIRVKARVFERLRAAANETLSPGELLDKAAGYFVRSYGANREAEAALRLAGELQPDNSMGRAMLAWCLYRQAEFSPRRLPLQASAEIIALTSKAVSLDPASYFARLIDALARQDLLGDFEGALAQAEAACELNSGFTQAQAMAGIARIHLGELEAGRSLLEDAMRANKDDPHRFRHQRELALASFYAGDHAEAAKVAQKLVEQAPDLKRNKLLLAGFLAAAGKIDATRQQMEALLSEDAALNLENVRLPVLSDATASKLLRESLTAAGLPA